MVGVGGGEQDALTLFRNGDEVATATAASLVVATVALGSSSNNLH